MLAYSKYFADIKKENFPSIMQVSKSNVICSVRCSCVKILLAEDSLFCIHSYWNMHHVAFLIKRQDSMKNFI